MEENLPTGTATEAKQNIDLKVEIEGLRKELQEKQELLLQAAQAMGLLEDSAKKLRETHAGEVAELNKQNEDLQVMGICLHSIKNTHSIWMSFIHILNILNLHRHFDQDEIHNIQKRFSLEETTSGGNYSSKDLSANNSQYDELQTIIHQNEQEIEQLKNSLKDLDGTLAERDAHIEELEQQLADVQTRSTNVEHSAELASTISQNVSVYSSKKKKTVKY